MNSPVVSVFVDADAEGAHDQEDDDGSGTNMQMGRLLEVPRSPSGGRVKFAGSASHGSRPSSLRDPEAESGCFHQEGKCNQVRLEAGVTRGDRARDECDVVGGTGGQGCGRTQGEPGATASLGGCHGIVVLLESATPAQSC